MLFDRETFEKMLVRETLKRLAIVLGVMGAAGALGWLLLR